MAKSQEDKFLKYMEYRHNDLLNKNQELLNKGKLAGFCHYFDHILPKGNRARKDL